MRTLVLALLLGAILALLSDRLKDALRRALRRHPALVFAAPLLLTAIFAASAAAAGAFSLPLAAAMLAYTLAPALCAYGQGPGPVKLPSAIDFAIVLMLWLPLEFAAGAALVPRPAQGFLHSVAYGVAILLSLVLFAGYRALPGMKYNLPRSARDYLLPAAALVLLVPVLMLVGTWLGFIPPFHAPARTDLGWMLARIAAIFAATALPEEILFRSLIQNALTLRLGGSNAVVLLAAAVFGCSHLNNGPLAAPNWRYAILATIAGFAFGKVFQSAGTVLSSAAVHAGVNTVKHFFF